jgi:ubiquitin-conjugating enzyme E2 G1
MAQRGTAQRMLSRMFQKLQDEPSSYFSCGLVDNNTFKWRCTIIGPHGSPYEGGIFPAELNFPQTFPNDPPQMRFVCPMWHPNIGKDDGKVCISILHKPGQDPNEYESASERWLPIHTVESIVISVISMLLDPNCESPLNVEAARDFKNNPKEYARKVRQSAQRSLEYC